MTKIDTSAEAVDRLADDLQMVRWPADQGSKMREDAAHALRALSAERDRLREALEKVHRRVQDQTGGRTFDDCSRDLMHADAICRAALEGRSDG